MNIDEIIAAALEEEFEERVEQYCTDTKKHRFSLAYRLWEYKTLRDLRKDRHNNLWTLRKARHVVAAAIIAASLLIGTTVYAAVVIGRYSFETKPDHSKLFIENLSSDKTSFEEYYGLPEENGWKLVNYDILSDSTMLNYECGEIKVTFCQNIIHEGNMGNINTENTVVESISLYEENDGFFIRHQSGSCSLYWIYDGYLFDLGGNITKPEAINLALSTKIINLKKFS